ncbi:F0F1 ATP synthase subunit A [Flavobacteriaceae bacterium M23B6Z8]
MIARKPISILLLLVIACLPLLGAASSTAKESPEGKEEFDLKELAMEHVMDAHEWHLADYNGHSISIPLPIILWDNGLKVFMSSEFEHGHKVVQKGDSYYKIYHEKIYKTNAEGELQMDEAGHPINEKPLDFSITKNVASMLLASLLIFLLFTAAARSYKKSSVPGGISGFLEPLVVFVRDDIAKPNIGEDKYKKFLPYLLTVFFFIWMNNLFGLLPIPPGGGANVTGNIAVTLVLSVFTMLITNISANKAYWQHIFWMPGVPIPIRFLLAPIELIGVISKPFALMIRLFANITAGHIIILCLTALIFVFKSLLVAPVSILFVLFMSCIELLVALLQAYIFTLLSALFIGLAVKEDEHH